MLVIDQQLGVQRVAGMREPESRHHDVVRLFGAFCFPADALSWSGRRIELNLSETERAAQTKKLSSYRKDYLMNSRRPLPPRKKLVS